MSTVFRRNRKGSDRDIIRLNSLGFSLAAIGNRLNCHPTSITLRLKSLSIRPADTRRSFMEDVFNDLPTESQEVIADTLHDQELSIKAYVKGLILNDLSARGHEEPTPTT